MTIQPLNDLNDGQSTEIQGNSGIYTLKRTGYSYYCSCPAWKNQSIPAERRTCKHLRQFRGDDAENYRIEQALIRVGIDPSTYNAASKTASRSTKLNSKSSTTIAQSGKPIVWSAMLAEKWDGKMDPSSWWMSEKLDGMRAYWDGKQLWSRENNKIYAPDWFLEGFPPFSLDGELFIGRKKFQQTISVTRRQDMPDTWKDIRYVIFDTVEDNVQFEDRFDHLRNWFSSHNVKYAKLHDIVKCQDFDHFNIIFRHILDEGGEGVILRKPKSLYERTRSNALLKVKEMQDTEVRVIGHSAGTGKYQEGMLGALIVELPNGKQFKIGTGLSDAERRNPPPIHSIVTVKYQELSNDGIPRFPVFVRIRTDVTWDDVINRVIENPVTEPKVKSSSSKKTRSRPSIESKETTLEQSNTKNETISATKEYYEYINEEINSAKFWELTVNGKTVSVRYGKIGSQGRLLPKEFGSEAEASKYAVKLRIDKLKEGYILK
jgi:DNA ligase-1